ncbi:sigma-70 family RNA polymerase sigma factor [Paenibacillus harenae]|uniref:sigma-70 family RNA polymerase sigma factor n=1 Tax=Paenibacillus harenae TaxID=306543 RepID=UPI002791EC45|nr:sigma-70 family RNA polymerase sigma factor [Paenibacillus harenae]MDQ0060543.1 RNA polymerase sigma-70 factor (ECF subfamily) [Paenibacillus harenae]
MSINDMELAAIEKLRPELTAYCYRMLGSIFEADDAVQDTLFRAWQSWDQFRQESSRQSWIYRIATNVCLDKLRTAKRRALSMNLSEPASSIMEPRDTLPRSAWIWPAPDTIADPAELVVQKNTIRLAFIAMLQTLPPRQRAVFILRDVFRWSAKEIGEALGMTSTAVNSGLQRARAMINRTNLQSDSLRDMDAYIDGQLLDRYVEAFEAYDIDALMALFHENGSLSMPPFVMWVRDRANLASFYEATRSHCYGSRLLPINVNGQSPAYAQYVPTGPEGTLKPWGIHVLEIKDGKIAHVHTFIESTLYSRFGLPSHLEARATTERQSGQ